MIIASAEGGMSIEELAPRATEKHHQAAGGRRRRLLDFQARAAGLRPEDPPEEFPRVHGLRQGQLARIFIDYDASLVEINPLVITGDGA